MSTEERLMLRHQSNLKSGSLEEKLAAASAISRIGPNAAAALPDVLAALKLSKDPMLTASLIETVGDLGLATDAAISTLTSYLQDAAPTIRLSAQDSLCKFGIGALPAADALIESLRASDILGQWALRIDGRPAYNDAPLALASIGPAVLPKLKECLKATQVRDRRLGALVAVTCMKTFPSSIEGDVIALLGDSDGDVRFFAASYFEGAELPPESALPKLILISGDGDEEPRTRSAAIRALGAFGEASQRVIPVLRSALSDGHHPVRIAALRSIEEIGPKAAVFSSELLKFSQGLQPPAASALAGHLPMDHHKEVAAILMMAERRSALSALIATRPDSEQSFAVVLEIISSGPPELLDVATRAALAVSPRSVKPVLHALEIRLRSDDDWQVANALMALRAVGSGAALLTNRVMDLLASKDQDVREEAALTLEAIRGDQISHQRKSPNRRIPIDTP